MPSHFRRIEERFEVLDDQLVRTVVAADGRSYAHRCGLDAYRNVAYAVDEAAMDGAGVTMESLAASEDVPFTQANVALEFLKERGVVVTRFRRSYPNSSTAFEDAMVEFHALREEAQHKLD
jgi:hypothetical protein